MLLCIFVGLRWKPAKYGGARIKYHLPQKEDIFLNFPSLRGYNGPWPSGLRNFFNNFFGLFDILMEGLEKALIEKRHEQPI